MIKAHTITVTEKSREMAEKKMAEEFNTWAEANPLCEIYHLFEPNRFSETYGDYNYNKYHTQFTFFYKELPVLGRFKDG